MPKTTDFLWFLFWCSESIYDKFSCYCFEFWKNFELMSASSQQTLAISLFFDCFFCKIMLVQLWRKGNELINDLMPRSCWSRVNVCTGVIYGNWIGIQGSRSNRTMATTRFDIKRMDHNNGKRWVKKYKYQYYLINQAKIWYSNNIPYL